jgi:hypothetical protein
MMKPLLLITLIALSFSSQSQNLDTKVLKAVQTVYNQYKLFFDSSLLDKYVILDTKKSYLVNSQTQKIKTLAIADNIFAFDEFSLSFAVVYNGDTIRHLPPCRLDTFQNLMALGTPSNPVQHGDLLPPYVQLAKGNIKFEYKKLKALLQNMKLEATAINLQNATGKQKYSWAVTTACPDIKCRQLQISATNGKILADKIP